MKKLLVFWAFLLAATIDPCQNQGKTSQQTSTPPCVKMAVEGSILTVVEILSATKDSLKKGGHVFWSEVFPDMLDWWGSRSLELLMKTAFYTLKYQDTKHFQKIGILHYAAAARFCGYEVKIEERNGSIEMYISRKFKGIEI